MEIYSGEQLVFLPGLDGTGLSFEPLRPFIAEDTKVTVVRYPTDELLSFQEIVASAASQVGSADGAVVIAESFSGPVAVELVGSGRLKPKCLVLSVTFARSPRRMLLAVARHLPLADLMSLPIPEALLGLMLGGVEFSPALLPLWHRMQRMVSPKVLAHRLNMVSKIDVRRWLSDIAIPCCYLQAENDAIVPFSSSQDFMTGMPDIQLKSIRGPHFILQARPEESIQLIKEFENLSLSIGKSVTERHSASC